MLKDIHTCFFNPKNALNFYKQNEDKLFRNKAFNCIVTETDYECIQSILNL